MAGDANWSMAINSVPIVFSKDEQVMAAWRSFLQAVRYKASAGNEEAANRDYAAKATTLIYRIAKKLKFDITENDIQNEAYYAVGLVERDNLMLEAFRALPRIAARQEELAKHLI